MRKLIFRLSDKTAFADDSSMDTLEGETGEHDSSGESPFVQKGASKEPSSVEKKGAKDSNDENGSDSDGLSSDEKDPAKIAAEVTKVCMPSA